MDADGTSVMQVKVEEQAPKLHYVHPRYFEAGKPAEFVACGSNLLQPKFRYGSRLNLIILRTYYRYNFPSALHL